MSIRSIARSLVQKFSKRLSSRTSRARVRKNQKLLIESLEQRQVMAVNPLLIEFSASPFTSAPQSLVEVNGTVYFQAATRGQGAELWKTDGTTAGTQLVKDIVPGLDTGSYPTNLTNFNATLYFTATDPITSQQELWKSDGTAAGTVTVDGPNGSSLPGQLTVVNNTLFFVGQRTITNSTGQELWKTDGTATGTVLVKDIVRGPGSSSPSSLVNVGGTLFFAATNASGGTELWKSDGTAATTVQVRDIVPGSYGSTPNKLVNIGGLLYFTANNITNGTELWKSNGTAAGTSIVRDIASGATGSYPYYLTNVNGTLFFSVSNELWKTDGTSLGTVQVESAPGGSSTPRNLTNVNGTLFFSALSNGIGEELWKSDGTSAGTVLVKDIDNSISSTTPRTFFNVGSTLYFTATTPAIGRELYKSDGTAVGTVLIKDINPGATGSAASYMMTAGGKLFFVAAEESVGRELWVSDGTAAGTTLTRDINPSSDGGSPNQSVIVGGIQYFTASNGPTGVELWKTDGTVAGTSLVKDIFAGTGGSYPSDLTNVNGTLYFVASDGTGRELWKSNGTAGGTVLVANLNGAYASTPQELVNIGSTLYFTASDNVIGRELWKTTGTGATTTLVSNINASSGSYPNKLLAVGTTLFFTADDGTNGRELWKSDGTTTSMVANIGSGSSSSYAANLTAVGSTLYFTAYTPFEGSEVWKSDGTPGGTFVVKNIVPDAYSGSYPSQLTNVNGTLYFSAKEMVGGNYELFKSNGTGAGTVLVEGEESLMNGPSELTNVNGVLYFTAFEEQSNTGVELWKSDGSLAGTSLVKDILPSFDSSLPFDLFNANGLLVFKVNLTATGEELWKSDGTAAGTLPLVDLWPGPLSSNITNLAVLGSQLTFTGDDGTSGIELFVLSTNQAPVLNVPPNPFGTNEDTSVAIAGISVSDVDADVADVQLTLSVGSGTLAINTSVPGGVVAANVSGNNSASLTVTAPQAAINVTLASLLGLTFIPAPNQSGVTTAVVNLNDQGNIGLGPALQATQTVTINIAAVNDAPSLTTTAASISFAENASATLIDPLAAVSDIDSSDFDAGTVTVQFAAAVDSADRLAIRNEGTSTGQIGVSGNAITFEGLSIGTIVTGQAGGNLSIQLNTGATPVAVTALLRNFQFSNISDNPVVAPRSLILTVTDGDGGTSSASTIAANVTAANDAPVLTISGATGSYIEDATATVLDATATVVDFENNWASGTLTVTIVSGGSAGDVLEVNHQGFGLNQIGLSSNFILFGSAAGPVVIGTFSGGTNGTPLSIALGAGATGPAVVQLLRSLTFRTLGDTPVVGTRSLTVQISDGAAAGSNTATKNVNVTAVNDAPAISNLGTPVSYTENGGLLVVTATATLLDPDSADFAGGVLTVSLTANGVSYDILGVRSQGNGAGQIGLSGTSVNYSGVQIGTVAGGTSLTPLTITLNSSATSVAVEALLRNIGYRANSDVPSDLIRTVQFVLSDGDGGTSLPVTQSVNVIPVNDRSVLAVIPSTGSYVENGSPVILAPAATVADVDSPNYNGGNLTIRYLSGGTADDRLAVRNEGYGVGQIGVAGLGILFGGQTIGSITATGGVGTTFLRIFLNVNSTPERTRALLRNITYSNVSDAPSTTPRTIEFLLNDGDGGTSASVTQVMSVTAVNDAPVVALPGTVPTYTSLAPAIDIDSTATMLDPDSTNFDTGVLTVSLIANASADDVLEIRNEGTSAGQIGVSGSNVTFGGVIIGSFSGGTASVPLSIALNAAAGPTAVQTLVRKITFRVNAAVTSTLSRSIGFQLTDGDGGSSGLVTKSVNVSL